MNGKFFWWFGSAIAVVFLLNVITASGHGSANQPAASPRAFKGPATSTFEVVGMTCKACELTVQRALTKLPGVQRVVVSSEQGNAVVTYDPKQLRAEQITAAIVKTGYQARRTMTCGTR